MDDGFLPGSRRASRGSALDESWKTTGVSPKGGHRNFGRTLSKTGGGASDLSDNKEVEILVAEAENRLRQMVMRIIRPALSQTADSAQKVETVQEVVERHETQLHLTEKLREEVASLSEIMTVVQRDLNGQAEQFRAFETKVIADTSKLRSGTLDLKATQEEQQAQLRQIDREVARAWEETSRLQNQHDEAMRKLTESMNAQMRQIERDRKETQTRTEEISKKHEDLAHDLLNENSGYLCKLKADIERAWNFVQPLREVQSNVSKCLLRMDELESHREEDEAELSRFRTEMQKIEEDLESRYKLFSEELTSVSSKFSAHHAGLLKDFRKNCFEEMGQLRQTCAKLQSQEVDLEKMVVELKGIVTSESKRMDALHKELVADMDDIQSKRKKERSSIDQDLREMRNQISQQNTSLAGMNTSIELMGKVLVFVVEGERIISSLEIQSFIDRSAETWLRAPDNTRRKAMPALGVEGLPTMPAASLQLENHELDSRHPMLQYDRYLPGTVQHNGSAYERRDLLVFLHKLLRKAATTLASDSQFQPQEASQGAAMESCGSAGLAAVAQSAPLCPVSSPLTAYRGGAAVDPLEEIEAAVASQQGVASFRLPFIHSETKKMVPRTRVSSLRSLPPHTVR